jgi:hypothetical protein
VFLACRVGEHENADEASALRYAAAFDFFFNTILKGWLRFFRSLPRLLR